MLIFEDRAVWSSKRGRRAVAALDPQSVESIAVIMHFALGDSVLTRPFFVTLREYFPNAKITASVIANYMHGIPEDLVDRIHVSAGKYRPRPSFFAKMKTWRALGYHDIIFDLITSNASFWVTKVNPAKLKVGFMRHFYHYFIYDLAVTRSDFHFISEIFLHQLNVLGLEHRWPLEFRYPTASHQPRRPYVMYCATASAPNRSWPLESYAGLMARMGETFPEYEHTILYGHTSSEEADAERVLEMAGKRRNISPEKRADLERAAMLLRHATMVVGNNSGIRNLAIANDTPTLGVFMAGSHFNYWPRFGLHHVVFEREGGPPSVERVFGEAADHLKRIEKERSR